MKIAPFLLYSLITLLSYGALAQKGTVERIKVYSKVLEGNLINDPAEREVSIYLPPSYENDANRRYPVVYMLHGFTSIDTQCFGGVEKGVNLPQRMEEGIAAGTTKEMIIVMPNAYNIQGQHVFNINHYWRLGNLYYQRAG
ncbi:MAG: alpha/beta hydrolase-fold protein [Bacteroidetes bacterium]|nr:alpha/beta hydrolase-fold protein [Bacteroidota bacterium]MDA1121847.1 alpha/beta hydrolase-fold protein [Bacteroidota bacterium]